MDDDSLDYYFHGSPDPRLTAIRNDGVFAGLFASSDPKHAQSHGKHLYVVRSPRPLTDFELNYSIDDAWTAALEVAGGNEAVACAIMDRVCPELPDCPDKDRGEQGWEHQRLRGVLAAKLGYTSVEMWDEHGRTWLCLPGCVIEPREEDVDL